MKPEADSETPLHEDPAVDRALAGLGRFSPRQGFEDRVVGLVRVPLPRWLRGLRTHFEGLTSGVTGWTVLATFSLATAAAWGTGATLTARYWGLISGATGVEIRNVLAAVRAFVTDVTFPAVRTGWARVMTWTAGLGIDPQAALLGYAVVVLVCLVALRWLTAEPARTRGMGNATR